MTFDEKLATAMRSDENFGKLWEEIKSEIKPFGNIFNFNDNNIDTEDSVVTDAYTDTDMNVKQFRTVNEAMLWLQETYSAPHSVNTSKKCIEFAAENGVKIQFVK